MVLGLLDLLGQEGYLVVVALHLGLHLLHLARELRLPVDEVLALLVDGLLAITDILLLLFRI